MIPYLLALPIFLLLALSQACADHREGPRPIDALVTTRLEQLTWMEVRDLLRQGTKRIIVPTGGIEQNGPFVALNKHDIIASAVSERAAKLLGDTLVAPVVSFVPEGNTSPPSGHMQFPGTISLTEETFIALLHDIGSSFAAHGFTKIALLGDSLDSQAGMKRAAEKLTQELGSKASFYYVDAFYDYDQIRAMLRQRGHPLTPEGFHEELPFTLQLLALDPASARYEQRRKAGLLSLNGTSLENRSAMVALGEEILDMRARATADAVRKLEGGK